MKDISMTEEELGAGVASALAEAYSRWVCRGGHLSKPAVYDLSIKPPSAVFGPASAEECRAFIHRKAARAALKIMKPVRPAQECSQGCLIESRDKWGLVAAVLA